MTAITNEMLIFGTASCCPMCWKEKLALRRSEGGTMRNCFRLHFYGICSNFSFKIICFAKQIIQTYTTIFSTKAFPHHCSSLPRPPSPPPPPDAALSTSKTFHYENIKVARNASSHRLEILTPKAMNLMFFKLCVISTTM